MTDPIAFAALPLPGDAPADPNPNAPGANVYSFQELAEYNPEAVLYVALGNKDHNVRLKVLVDYVLGAVGEAQIPEDVVRQAAMELFVNNALDNLEIPTAEITDANLEEKVLALQGLKDLVERITAVEGKVEQLTPPDLTKYAQLASGLVRNKAVVVDANGALINTVLGSTRLVYVYKRRTAATFSDGSLEAPYESIQEALDSVGTSITNAVILIQPSQSGNYAGFNVTERINLMLVGYGCTDAHTVRIDGAVTNTGAGGTRLRLKDVQIKQTDANVPAYTHNGTQARDYFKNVTMEPASSSQTTPVMVLTDVRNWIDFEDCNISGLVLINGTSTNSALVAFRSANADKMVIDLQADTKVLINNTTRIGSIKQSKGIVEVNHTHNFVGDAQGVAIDSTGGEVSLSFTNLFKGAQSLKIKRAAGLSPVRLNRVAIDPNLVTGPVDFVEKQLALFLARPQFTGEVIPEPTLPERSVKVTRTSQNGYFYDKLSGRVLQVAAGAAATTATAITSFELVGKEVTVPVTKAPSTDEFYVELTDAESQGAVFIYGPFTNT